MTGKKRLFLKVQGEEIYLGFWDELFKTEKVRKEALEILRKAEEDRKKGED